MIEVFVESIRVNMTNYRRVVMLKEKTSPRYLPIWIGHFEADAIAIPMQNVPVSRPLTHDLLKGVIEQLGGKLTQVVINELAEASGTGLRLEAGRIPIRQPTLAICQVLQVDPLRLIASGALLIACGDGERMARGLGERGIPASVIGQLTEGGARELIHPDGGTEPIVLTRDELYRLLEVQGALRPPAPPA